MTQQKLCIKCGDHIEDFEQVLARYGIGLEPT